MDLIGGVDSLINTQRTKSGRRIVYIKKEIPVVSEIDKNNEKGNEEEEKRSKDSKSNETTLNYSEDSPCQI